MKKTLLIAAATVALAVSTQAQGYVLFQNAGNTRISTNSVVGGAGTGRIQATDGTVANEYYFALLSSTAQNTTENGVSTAQNGAAGLYAFNAAGWSANPAAIGTNSIAGQFASIGADPNNSGQTALTSGAAQTFVIIGWSANIGSTLSALQTWYNGGNPLTAGYIGESAVSGVITPSAGGVSLAQAVMGTSSPLIPGFTLGLVSVATTPEPGTIALAGLGGLALLGLRRKKA